MHPTGVITIAGELGSGKSTVVGLLGMMLPGHGVYSTGRLFRKLAEERGLTVNELTALADTDGSIDRLVDCELAAFGKTAGDAIIDSRMAWHFLPRSFKVYLTVNMETAARRILNSSCRGSVERYATCEEALAYIKRRTESERARYLNAYGVDIRNHSNYDLVLDTTAMMAEEAAERVLAGYRDWTAQ